MRLRLRLSSDYLDACLTRLCVAVILGGFAGLTYALVGMIRWVGP